ncbi:cytochrome c peroxidase [Mesorhizobium sp. CAU 1741]|uniref:cytochrome-c peroxidase n=1 Tax=Mesorhizobium sp. CAU 1741 TaxID=3140366 RepID=UPI00325A6B16
MSRWFIPFVLAVLLGAHGCTGEDFSAEEKRLISQLRLSQLGPLPADPGNRVADDPVAAALGEALFFDARLSGDGVFACATCHLPGRQFQDDRPLGRAAGITNRRTMPLAGVGHSQWFFWDGRKDSLWSQALGPMEDVREQAGNRTAFAHLVAASYREDYEALFGAVPDLSGLPQDASPLGPPEQRAAWSAISASRREDVDRLFANLGKALAAFVRTINHTETRFDRFAEAIVAGREPEDAAAFNSLEIEGLKLFIGKANCIDCHNGPRFTDEFFHNTGVAPVTGLPKDRGRAQAVAQVLADPFNCMGPYSDAGEDGCSELRFMVRDAPEFERAYKTPSLRGAAGRPPYMHSGQIATLEDVIAHYSEAPVAVSGRSELEGVIFTDRGKAALIAFLKTLE